MKNVQKKILRIMAATLSAVMLVQALPIDAMASEVRRAAEYNAEQEAISNYSTNVTQEAEPTVVAEDKEHRESNVKHFMLSDRTVQAVVYPEPVHYLENGEWKDIDNTLSLDLFRSGGDFAGYENKENAFQVRFAKSMGQATTFRISENGYSLSWKYESQQSTLRSALAIAEPVKTKAVDHDYLLEKVNQSLIYKNAAPGTDFSYTVTGSGVKENIIVNEPQEGYDYSFIVQTEKLTLGLEGDGSISAKNEAGEAIFSIPAPFMFDAKGNPSKEVQFALEETEDGYRIDLHANAAWINDAERAFPVTIDPVIQSQQKRNSIDSTYVISGKPNDNRATDPMIMVGKDSTGIGKAHGLLKFDLPKLNKGDVVVSANLSMAQVLADHYADTTPDAQINVYPVKSGWSRTSVTWNKQPSYGSLVEDYAWLRKSEKNAKPSVKNWIVTDIVKQWYEGTLANNGVMLKSNLEDKGTLAESCIYAWYYGERYAQATAFPVLSINYRNNKGLESYWTYSSFGAGEVGTASVNEYSGNLVFTREDAATAGERMPASISHVFNNYLANQKPKMAPYVGHGWRLSVSQTLLPSSQYGLTGDAAKNYPYVYTDGDGTEHYFQKVTKDGKTQLLDEDGLDLTLTEVKTSNTEYYKVSDDKDNIMMFNKSGNLSYTKDANGNKVTNSYLSESNQTLTKVQDGAGKSLTLTETDTGIHYLRTITDAAGRKTNFWYNGALLDRYTAPDGTHGYFTYDGDGSLTGVRDDYGYELQFTYSALDKGKRVTKVVEKSADGTGQTVTFDYSQYNQTTIRTGGLDGVYGNSDDIITVKQFDSFGRTVSTQSTCNGKSLGASSANLTGAKPNGDASNIRQLNRVSRELSAGKDVENILIGGNMEAGSDWNNLTWNGQASFTGGISTEEAYFGQKSYKLNSTGAPNGSGARACQGFGPDRLVPGRTYTYSAYVKTKGVTQERGNYGACLMATTFSPDGNKDNFSEYIKGTADTHIDGGWQRLSVTFEVPVNVTQVTCNLMLREAKGTAYFDGVQLEEAETANLFNLLENSSFERVDGNSAPAGWTAKDLVTKTSDITVTSQKHTRSRSFRIVGDAVKPKELTQDVAVKGTEDDTYILSGWAKADSLPDGKSGVEFRLCAQVFYTDGTNKYKTTPDASFNRNVGGWQYSAFAFNLDDGDTGKTRTPNKIRVYISYKNEANTAYFDDIQLVKDEAPSYTYDKDGHLVTVAANAEQNSKMEYSNSNLTSQTDPKGFKYTYTYDGKHNLTQAKSQRGVLHNYTYNTNGNPTQYVIQNGSGTEKLQSNIEYTSNGAFVTKTTDQHGYATTYDYNQNTGMLISVTDANGNTVRYTYNVNNDRLQSTAQTMGNGTESNNSFEYSGGNLTKINHNGFSYGFGYDGFGNILKTSVGSQTLSTNTYGANNGDLQKVTYGNGATVGYTYDNYGNTVAMSQNGSTNFRWKFDSTGYATQHDDLVNALKYDYTYDTTGRLIRQTVRDESKGAKDDRGLYRTEYQYDQNNNITKFTNQAGGRTHTEQYTYGKDNLPETYTMPNGINKTFQYGAINRPYKTSIQTEMPVELETLYRLSERNKEGQSDFRTMQVHQEKLGTIQYRYGYDKLGNITSIETRSGGEYRTYATYHYDELNRLEREDNIYTGKTKVYNYDASGNILTETEYRYIDGELDITGTPINTHEYGYDDTNWKDKLTSYKGQGINYDAIGNPLSYRGYALTWQNGRQLKSFSGNGTTASYQYDASDLRTEKNVNGKVTEYRYVGDQLVYEKRSGQELYYFYDVEGALSGIRLISEGQTSDYIVVTNWRHDIEALYDISGDLVARYFYHDAWGNQIAIKDAAGSEITNPSHIANVNPFRYRGYYLDMETGLYYLNARYYDSETHRFINSDAIIAATDAKAQNAFVYCLNNPVNMSDSTGNWPKWMKKAYNVAKNAITNIFGFGASSSTVTPHGTPDTNNYGVISTEVGSRSITTVSAGGKKANNVIGKASYNSGSKRGQYSLAIKKNYGHSGSTSVTVGHSVVGIDASSVWKNIKYAGGISVSVVGNSRVKVEVAWSVGDADRNTVIQNYANVSMSIEAIIALFAAGAGASQTSGNGAPTPNNPPQPVPVP